MATYDEFERRIRELMLTGCNVDEAIDQVQEEWLNSEEAVRHALLAKQNIDFSIEEEEFPENVFESPDSQFFIGKED